MHIAHIKSLLALTALAALALLAGCASVVPAKRHSPEEIARYQPSDFSSPIARENDERANFATSTDMVRDLFNNVDLVNLSDESQVKNALWTVKFLNIDRSGTIHFLNRLIPTLDRRSTDLQRAALSTAHAIAPLETQAAVLSLLPKLQTSKEFSIAAYSLLAATAYASNVDQARSELSQRIASLLEVKFPGQTQEPRLRMLQYAISKAFFTERKQRPPLVDLLTTVFTPSGQFLPVVYSFQRNDRTRIGLAMVRGTDGQFIRNADGGYFNIPHLAMALTNLPGTITNGNTPQGLFTIVGTGTAKNQWIGPTPYLESKVPVEATTVEFDHAQLGTVTGQVAQPWTMSKYESFLPTSWRNYFPFKEAFFAGLAGRDEMLLHGTTINPDYYQGASFYPGTPSAGCLVAFETWSKQDGRLQTSNQLSLLKAFTRDGIDRGYLVVVELDDINGPVTLEEVLPHVVAAEKITQRR